MTNSLVNLQGDDSAALLIVALGTTGTDDHTIAGANGFSTLLMTPQKPDNVLIYIAYFPFATKRLLGEFDCERSPCTQRSPAQTPSLPNAFQRMPGSMKSRASSLLA
ncbi:hypothetical protein [Aestuariivirga sp.]|uniref:hypothetical protein n=1 Tax=Aestuariivirga sp. TaxID=2650926 RepID=UPI0035B3D2D1